jgi:hypothetical protein
MKPEEVVGEGNDDYAALQDNEFVRDRRLPGSDTRSLVHTSDGVTTVACKPDSLINERDLPQSAYRHGAEYIIRFLEYREHMLRNYLDSGRGQHSAALIKTVIKFNRTAIENLEDDWNEAQR